MSTEVTPESLRAHAEWLDDPRSPHYKENKVFADGLHTAADRLEREQRPLPTVPGWYLTIVVERGGESCTGAMRTRDGVWGTALPVDYSNYHDSDDRDVTIRWAEQDGKTPAHSTPTLTDEERSEAYHDGWNAGYYAVKPASLILSPVGEHPEPGTRGLLPVVVEDDAWQYDKGAYCCLAGSETSTSILADPRPGGV